MNSWFADSFAWNMAIATAAEIYVERRLSEGVSPQVIGRDEAGMRESFQRLLAISMKGAVDLRRMMEPFALGRHASRVTSREVAEQRWTFGEYAGAVRDCLRRHGSDDSND